MTEHFRYYDDWKSVILECAQCGWKGTFEQGSVDYFEQLKDSSCSTCGKMLATVSNPTDEETDANLDKLTDEERQSVTARKRFLAEWEASCLKSADQLPDLEGSALTLKWDVVGRKGGRDERLYTVIRHGEQEVWRERAVWEGYERFEEVVKILKAKYGHRLWDVVPTDASTLYLYGDRISAIDIVQKIRESFSKLRLIRANLGASWALGQQIEQEDREIAEERAQVFHELEGRIEAAQPLSAAMREQFLAEIERLIAQEKMWPNKAKWLKQVVRGPLAPKRRKR